MKSLERYAYFTRAAIGGASASFGPPRDYWDEFVDEALVLQRGHRRPHVVQAHDDLDARSGRLGMQRAPRVRPHLTVDQQDGLLVHLVLPVAVGGMLMIAPLVMVVVLTSLSSHRTFSVRIASLRSASFRWAAVGIFAVIGMDQILHLVREHPFW